MSGTVGLQNSTEQIKNGKQEQA